MLLNLIQGRDFDLLKFARTLERDAQEGVRWELRKLQWLLEDEAKCAAAEAQEVA